MVFAARVAEVVIASPDDTDRFRPAIGQALNWWNAASGQRHEIVLMPSGGQRRTAGAERLNPSAESAQIVDRGDEIRFQHRPQQHIAEQDEEGRAEYRGGETGVERPPQLRNHAASSPSGMSRQESPGVIRGRTGSRRR